MKREFVIMPQFDKNWKSMGLTDEHLFVLEDVLLRMPEIGTLIEGTGGLRKLRFQLENNKGKSR